MSQQRIVCTGNEAFGLEVRRLVLESFGYRARVLPNCAAISESIAAKRIDLVILDYTELEHEQQECVRNLRASHPAQRIMLVAPVPYLDSEVSSLVDCVLMKGSSPDEFREAVQSCIGNDGSRKMIRLATFIGTVLGVAHLLFKGRKASSKDFSAESAAEPLRSRMVFARSSARSANS